MRKKFFKKLMAAATAMLLTIGSVLPAAAATTTADIKTVEEECSITLHLYGSNSASNTIGTGTTGDEPSLPKGAEPVEGATFKYVKVGEVVQYNDGTTVGIRYKITDSTFAAAVGVNNQNSAVVDTTNYIVPDDLLQDLWTTATKAGSVNDLIGKLEIICKDETAATDEEGKVTVSQATGLYVFIGGSMPESVISHVTPFLVAAPMPNLIGTGWNTDIHVYPKVSDNDMTLKKEATQNGVTNTRILVESGKPVEYTVTLSIPGKTDAGDLAQFTKFELKDKMASGLQPVVGRSSFVVKQGEKEISFTKVDGEINIIPPSADNGLTTSVVFLEAGLTKLNDLLQNGDAKVVLKYSAVLGEGATLGSAGNANNVELFYERENGTGGTLSTSSNVHTYGIVVEKKLSDNAAVGNKVINFKLTRVEGTENGTPVKFLKTEGEEPNYWVDEDDENATDVLSVPADGNLNIYGLLPGTYQLEETQSAHGYSKLDKPITIVITAPMDASSYSTSNGTATADGQSMKTGTKNAFQLTVVNTKIQTGFTLPNTGGAGMLFALAAGFGLVGFSVLVLVSRRKGNNQ